MKYTAIIVTLLVISGCTVQKQWIAAGGSKSDGTVVLGYERGDWAKAVVNEQQGIDVANARCAAWGYSGSEAFGMQRKKCTAPDGLGGCQTWLVTKQYQCTD